MSEEKTLCELLLALIGKLLIYVLLGGLFALGIKAIEWLIPAPESRLFVCAYDDRHEIECKSAAELLRNAASKT